jgi:hypothetical protein
VLQLTLDLGGVNAACSGAPTAAVLPQHGEPHSVTDQLMVLIHWVLQNHGNRTCC